MKLTEKEQKQLEDARKEEVNRKKCTEEILEVLNKFGLELNVNPESPLGNPQIILTKKNTA